jgi:hypothetical protein
MKKYFIVVLVMITVTVMSCIGVSNKITEVKTDSTSMIVDSTEVVADTTAVDSIQ